jgi:hypothetical protein
MTERELRNFSQWSLSELQEAERSYPSQHQIGDEIRAEIRRRTNIVLGRRKGSNMWYAGLSVIVAILGLGFAVYLALSGQ